MHNYNPLITGRALICYRSCMMKHPAALLRWESARVSFRSSLTCCTAKLWALVP